MKSIFRNLFWLILALLLTASSAAANEPITILNICLPPYYICGQPEVTGIIVDIEEELTGRMPEQEFTRLTVNNKRVYELLKGGGRYLFSAAIKTFEREKFLYYSRPIALAVPMGINFRAEDAARFGDAGEASLRALLGNGSLTLGINAGRSYGIELDAILKEFEGQDHIRAFYSEENTKQLINLLKAGRIDYALGYPLEFTFTANQMGGSEWLGSLALVEKKVFNYGHVVAPKTPWGKEMIDRIDVILSELINTGFVYRQHQPWISPLLKPAFDQQFNQFIVGGDKTP